MPQTWVPDANWWLLSWLCEIMVAIDLPIGEYSLRSGIMNPDVKLNSGFHCAKRPRKDSDASV